MRRLDNDYFLGINTDFIGLDKSKVGQVFLTGDDKLSAKAIGEIEMKTEPGYDQLNVLQAKCAEWALRTVQASINLGYMKPSQIKRILDFGAGTGGPTFALKSIARVLDAKLQACEIHDMAQVIAVSGILPSEDIIREDGIAYLEALDERGRERYDLVTAFMLGPDGSGRIFSALANACGMGLAPDGNLLVTSDTKSLSAAHNILINSGVGSHRLSGERIVPDGFLIPRSSCLGVQFQLSTSNPSNGNLQFIDLPGGFATFS